MKRRAWFDPRPKEFQRVLTEEEEDKMVFFFLKEVQFANREEDTIWQKHLFFKYPDYKEDNDYLERLVKVLFKRLLKGLSDAAADAAGPFMIAGTLGQSKSEIWLIARALRITGSDAKKILRMTPDGFIKFLRSKLWGLDGFTSKFTAYGTRMEPKARKAYLAYRKKIDNTVEVEETGLWSNTKHPQIAGSFDAVVKSRNLPTRLAEFKCPETIKLGNPKEFEKCLTKEQIQRFCLMRDENGKVKLKPKHAYWYQIQLYMGIFEVQECDFVVWSPKDIHVETITFDKEEFDIVATDLKRIHRELLVPEYFLCRAPRNLPPVKLTYKVAEKREMPD